jgi:hypothetical protein
MIKKDQQEYQKLTEAYSKIVEGEGDEFDMAGQSGLGPLDDKPDPELSQVPPGPPRYGHDELKDSQGREIEIGDIVQLGMSDRQYVVVDFGAESVEIAELGPTKGYDAEELEVVGELGG